MPNSSDRQKRAFKDLLSKVPAEIEDDLREGFSLIGQLTAAQLNALVEIGLASIDEPHFIDEPSVQEKLGLDEERSAALAVVAMTLGMSPSAKESTEEVIALLKERFSLNPDQVGGARTLIEEFDKRSIEASSAVQKRTLASKLLPSFEHFRSTVDLRLMFTDEEASVFAPVAIAHLTTDAAPPLGRFWFQMSKSELKRLIAEAQETLREMERVERWAAKRMK
jgi:hypothetical protein